MVPPEIVFEDKAPSISSDLDEVSHTNSVSPSKAPAVLNCTVVGEPPGVPLPPPTPEPPEGIAFHPGIVLSYNNPELWKSSASNDCISEALDNLYPNRYCEDIHGVIKPCEDIAP